VYVTPTQSEVDITSPKLIRAIIKAESRGNPKAVSNKGCIGLMGINWKVWKKELRQIGIYNKEQLYHPDTNIRAGKYILAKHHKWAKGDIVKTLVGYSGNARFYSERVIYYYMTEAE
jgi:soluble lytic murein transglycosylase-like protein